MSMDEAARKEVGRRMAAGRAAKKAAAISGLMATGRAKTTAEAEAILKAERKAARAGLKEISPEASAPAHILEEPKPGTAIPGIAVKSTFVRYGSRDGGLLHVANKDPKKSYRWVRNDQTDRRKMMGYEVVPSTDQAKTFVSNMAAGAGGARQTFDSVLMSTSKENAEAVAAAPVEKARAWKKRAKENLAEAASRDGAAAGKSKSYAGSIFGTVTSERGSA